MKFHFLRGFLATSAFFLLMASSSNSTYYCCCYGTSMKMLTTTTLLRERPFLFTQHPAFRSSSLCLFLSTDHNSNNQQQHDAATTTKTLAPGSHCTELLVKKSRFVAYAASVDSWPQAQDYLSEIKLQHPKARHWCWGYVGGGSQQQQQQQQQRQHEERCSDDGEPTGTAGLPILGAIHGEGLEQVMCVVVRYFGGIKLGAGGLIRSYGAAARQTLREAPVQVLVPVKRLRVRVDSASHVGVLYETIGKVSGTTTASGEVYGDDGSLTMDIVCQAALEGQFRESLQDATRGSAVFLSNDDEYDSSAD